MDLITIFGRRLRSLRKARSLTQEQLGDKANVSYKFLGAVERGEENPSLKFIGKLAKALGVETRDLFEFAHEEPSLAKLRKLATQILKNASEADLRLAVKVLKTLQV